MKTIAILPFFGIGLLSMISVSAYSQQSINIVVQFGRPCGIGRGLCSIEELVDTLYTVAANRNHIYMDGLERINLKVLKSSLSDDIEEIEFKNKQLYLLQDDFQILKEKNLEIPIVICKGAHPLIELEDSYIISFPVRDNQ